MNFNKLEQRINKFSETWTISDIKKFLILIRLESYYYFFFENQIDGTNLNSLTIEDCIAIGMTELEYKKILRWVESLAKFDQFLQNHGVINPNGKQILKANNNNVNDSFIKQYLIQNVCNMDFLINIQNQLQIQTQPNKSCLNNSQNSSKKSPLANISNLSHKKHQSMTNYQLDNIIKDQQVYQTPQKNSYQQQDTPQLIKHRNSLSFDYKKNSENFNENLSLNKYKISQLSTQVNDNIILSARSGKEISDKYVKQVICEEISMQEDDIIPNKLQYFDIQEMVYDIINRMLNNQHQDSAMGLCNNISDVINLENYDLNQKQYQEPSVIQLEDIEDYIFNSESDQFKFTSKEFINFNRLLDLSNNNQAYDEIKIIEKINEVHSNLEQSSSEDELLVQQKHSNLYEILQDSLKLHENYNSNPNINQDYIVLENQSVISQKFMQPRTNSSVNILSTRMENPYTDKQSFQDQTSNINNSLFNKIDDQVNQNKISVKLNYLILNYENLSSKKNASSQTFLIKNYVNPIGRDKNSLIALHQLDISRFHAQITHDAETDKFYLQDLGSTFGTFYSLKKTEKIVQLGDYFQMGQQSISIKNISYINDAKCQITFELEQIERDQTKREVTSEIDREDHKKMSISIGRSSQCTLRFQDDEQMSNNHAYIIRDGNTLILHDRSLNGTWVRLSAAKVISKKFEICNQLSFKVGINSIFTPKFYQIEYSKFIDQQENEINEIILNLKFKKTKCKLCNKMDPTVIFLGCSHVMCGVCYNIVKQKECVCPFCEKVCNERELIIFQQLQ